MDDTVDGRGFGAARARHARGDPRLDPLRRLAVLLDDAIVIPGTGLRFGFDPLIGLVPGLGDVAGAVIGAYVLLAAWRLGAPTSVLLRVSANLALDAAIGAVPFAGDLADFAFKANARNVRVLERWLEAPGQTRRASRAVVAGLALAALAIAAAVGYGAWRLLAWSYGVVTAR